MRQPRVLLASRYEIVTPISSISSSRCYLGFDTSAGRSVVVRLTVPPESRWLAAARGATHRHLAAVIDVLDNPDSGAFPDSPAIIKGTVAIVAEALRGLSLDQYLSQEPLGLDRSVAWVLRVAEAVRCLHSRGAAHGALSTHSILASARGRAIPPVVTQLLTPQIGAFASPERLSGEGPSLSDDLWAIGVLLHVLVSGFLPFQGQSPAAVLQEIQVSNSTHLAAMGGPYMRELEAIAARFIAPQRRRRPSSIDDVIDALDRWERRSPLPAAIAASVKDRVPSAREAKLAVWDTLTFDDSQVPRDFDAALAAVEEARAVTRSVPPAAPSAPVTASSYVPQGSAAGNRLSVSAEGGRPRLNSESFSVRLRSRPRWGVLGVLVALVGAGAGAAVVSAFGSISNTGRSIVNAVQSHSSAAPAASLSRAREHVNPKKELDTCLRSYFPTDAFATDPDLGFVCANESLVDVTQRLNALAAMFPVDSADAGALAALASATAARARTAGSAELVVTPSTGTRTWQLGWYELLATAIIQRNCCREPPVIKLPVTSGWCQQLQVVVTNIAVLSTKSGDISSAVHAFDEAITCLMSQGRHTVYSYKGVPTVAQKAAFQQFLTHAAEMDAKRASNKF